MVYAILRKAKFRRELQEWKDNDDPSFEILNVEYGVVICDEGRWVKVLERNNWSFRAIKALTLVRIILHL